MFGRWRVKGWLSAGFTWMDEMDGILRLVDSDESRNDDRGDGSDDREGGNDRGDLIDMRLLCMRPQILLTDVPGVGIVGGTVG